MKSIKKFTQIFEAEEDQLVILKTKLDEYNANKSKIVSFLNSDNKEQLFDSLLASLKYKDNDLLRYEWAYQKSAADVKKYKDLIDKTIQEYNTKKI